MAQSVRISRRFLLCTGLTLAATSVAPFSSAQAASNIQRIGIIGSGQVGGTLGRLWAQAGYKVMFSSRHPEKLQDLVASAGPNAQAGSVNQAIDFADIILLAVPYKAEPLIASLYGKKLSGKILIDADNAYPFRDGAIAEKAHDIGVARYSAKLFPGTYFVRAFNSVNASNLFNGGGGNTEVSYSYTNDKAGAVVSELIKSIGCIPVRAHDL